ncbi:Fur family transcriptional regulator [Tepidiforma sp.]|uniref:Fur family transcriptional regulator n=1 Tax=Tepidiforma sp. TaxID=2682230 RepID=UPI002ADE1171|nr:Fur family transcriptional regulator [Tepidiforma sp.]
MSCENDIAERLRRAGFRLTPQRLLIVRALRHGGRHMSAGEIAEEVHKVHPYVDLSTVYRTLDVLKRTRLVTSTDMGSGDVLFEWAAEEPHHHLICSVCGHVVEIGPEYFRPLEERLRTELGFEPDMHHFAVFGLCRECRDSAGDEDGDEA